MTLREERLVSLVGILIGALIALYLAHPYLNSSFITAAVNQPRQVLERLNDFSYTATFNPLNRSIVIHMFNPNNFTVYVESVKGPGFSSTSEVPVPPMTNATIVVNVYNAQELIDAYDHHNLTVTVVLKFLNTTLTVMSS